MPISLDFEALAAPFRAPIGLQLRTITEVFERLGKFLKKRAEGAEALERATRAFPILRFYDGALAAWIDRSQRGALTPGVPEPSFWDALAASGRAFVAGLGRIPQAAREEWLLPGLIATLGAAVRAIEDSV